MLKIKITWPLAILVLIGLLVWIIRTADPPRTAKPTKQRRSAARPMPHRNGPGYFKPPIIHADDAHPFDAADSSDYDAETKRLDREAADAARATHAHSSAQYTPIRKGDWQK